MCPPELLDSEDKLFMLYTSGSTGKPKGIVHTQAGYLLYASLTQQVRHNCSNLLKHDLTCDLSLSLSLSLPLSTRTHPTHI